MQVILCPNCETEISLDEIASSKFKKELKKQELKLKKQEEDFKIKLEQDKIKQREIFEKELEEKTKEMREKAVKYAEEKAEKERKKEREKLELEMKDMQEQLKEVDKIRKEANEKELEFLKNQRKLREKEKNLELELEKKVLKEKEKILKEQEEENKKQEEARKKELEKELLLKIEQTKKEQEKLRKKEQEEFRKKELELLKQQEQMKRALDEAKRKAEQWSQQIQWDIQEEDLKNILTQNFPIDNIEDVPTWIKWADLIQIVNNSFLKETWIILWESKNTKAWSNDWIKKLNDDKVMAKASVAVLVTKTLPKDISHFWLVNWIWVTLPEYIIELTLIIREQILSIDKIKKSLEWKDEKMEALYWYLSSEEFWWKVKWIITSFISLKEWIETEKRAMNRIWSKREKELERVINNTSMMYWDLEWIIWNSLASVEYLMLDDWNSDSKE